MKVLFMTNYPTPYRVDFFNELGKYCDLTVTFEESEELQLHRDPSWFHTSYDAFKAVLLKQSMIKKNGHNIVSWEIIREVRKHYDYIIVGVYSTFTSMVAIEYMILNHIPYTIEVDGGIAKSGKGFVEKLKHHLISHAESWFSTGSVSDEYLIFYGAKREKIYRYPFSSIYEKDIFHEPLTVGQKEMIKKKLGITERKVVLSVGQFIPRKGFDLLIRSAMALPKDVGVYIVGGRAPQEYIDLRKQCKLEKQIHFVDFKKGDELNAFYSAADLFVLPTREDMWGLVINEAMSKGLPVITTDKCVAGLELVDEENGAIVAVDHVEELSDKMLEFFASDEEKRCALGKKSIERIRGYSFEKMVSAHLCHLQGGEC